jgi:ketosteroid isomerase-like protein
MSAEEVELIRRWTDAFNRRDFDTMLDSLDPEVELHEWPTAPGAETYRGPEGALRAIDKWFDVWEWMRVEIEDIVEAGNDRVLVTLHQRAKGKGSTIEVEIKSFNVYTFRDGRLFRIELFTELEPALESAGLAGTDDVAAMLQGGYEAFNRGDYEAFADILDPDVQWQHSLGSGAPEEGVYHGRDEVLRLMGRLRDAWEEQSLNIEEVVEIGADEYAVRGVVHATGKTSSLELDANCEWTMKLRDGKATRVRFALTGPAPRSGADVEPQNSDADVIRAVNEAVGSDDMRAIAERLHEDVVWEHNIGGGSPEEGVYRGRENVIALFERILEPWEILRLEVREVVELGERLFQVEGELHFKHLTSAAEVTEPYVQRIEVQDGLLVRGEMAYGALARESGRRVVAREERSR